jgi:hypothetical protein
MADNGFLKKSKWDDENDSYDEKENLNPPGVKKKSKSAGFDK